jgi:hypothetical protein
MAAAIDAVSRSAGRRGLLARILAYLALAGFAVGALFTVMDAMHGTAGTGDPVGDAMYLVAFAAFPMIGYALATRRPENTIGWLMLGMGTFLGVSATISSIGWFLFHTGRDTAGLVLLAIDSPSWIPVVVVPVTFLALLFPDGHLPSPRWRWFAWALGIGLAIVYLAILLDPQTFEESRVSRTRSASRRSGRCSTRCRR